MDRVEPTTIGVTVAGLLLAFASVLLAWKQLHAQRNPARRAVLTFQDVEFISPDRCRVTAKNGGEATARHVRVWLRDSRTGAIITDDATVIGSLMPKEPTTVELRVLSTYSGPVRHAELWYAWQTEDRQTRGPERSDAPRPSLDDWSVGSRAEPKDHIWSLAFVFDRRSQGFHWANSHSDIYGELGVQDEGAVRDELIPGRVASDGSSEIFDRTISDEEANHIRDLAVANAPHVPDGGLARPDEIA